MLTVHPTTDHLDAPAPGSCPCTPGSVCPECMGKLQRERHDRMARTWLKEWDRKANDAVVWADLYEPRFHRRPLLRVIQGGR